MFNLFSEVSVDFICGPKITNGNEKSGISACKEDQALRNAQIYSDLATKNIDFTENDVSKGYLELEV